MGVAGKERVTFFREGGGWGGVGDGSFYIKNKLKSEIYNNKKSLSVTTKNLILEIRVGWGGRVNKKTIA